MPSSNFVVTSLPDYVQENHDILIKNFGLIGGDTRKRISIQTGVKKDANINLLDLAPVLQDGAACSFDASGSATLSQRIIETSPIKVNMDICPKNLRGKYAEYLIRNNATENDLPFEKYIMDGVIKEINKKIETLIWQGDKSKITDADLKWINGFLAILVADGTHESVTWAATATAYEQILAVYNAIPEAALERGAEIYVSPAKFRAFLQNLVALNLFHYNPGNENPNEFTLPGSDTKVVKTPGLAGSDYILATYPENLVYGCDMEGDSEDIDLWWSRDDRLFKLAVEWNSGVQVVLPDMIVLGEEE